MAGIDETRDFKPIRIAIMTVSDSRHAADDESGSILVGRLENAGHTLADRTIVKDEVPDIVAQLKKWIDDPEVDAVISTGGTGITGRDVTPEAFRSVFEKEIDGFSTVFHMVSYQTVATSTLQSRACAGIAGGTLLFAVPGSPGACKDAWDGIFQYQLDSRHRPCNFVEILPRLEEHKG